MRCVSEKEMETKADGREHGIQDKKPHLPPSSPRGESGGCGDHDKKPTYFSSWEGNVWPQHVPVPTLLTVAKEREPGSEYSNNPVRCRIHGRSVLGPSPWLPSPEDKESVGGTPLLDGNKAKSAMKGATFTQQISTGSIGGMFELATQRRTR